MFEDPLHERSIRPRNVRERALKAPKVSYLPNVISVNHRR